MFLEKVELIFFLNSEGVPALMESCGLFYHQGSTVWTEEALCALMEMPDDVSEDHLKGCMTESTDPEVTPKVSINDLLYLHGQGCVRGNCVMHLN